MMMDVIVIKFYFATLLCKMIIVIEKHKHNECTTNSERSTKMVFWKCTFCLPHKY